MARAFSQIAFTPSVRAAQDRYGSRAANAGFDAAPDARDRLGALDRAFIGAIDTCFLSSVGDNGWPYVQHRGGPPGFIKVLDEHTIGFADFAGNRQYISAGNVANDGRVMLILMDFANRARLKIWGHARIVHEHEDPALVARLEVPTYRARIERAYVITVSALDYNCPQHITPRFTERELAEMAGTARRSAEPPASLGSGPLELDISAVRQLTPRVRSYELRRPGGEPLPAIAPGAHLALPVRLDDGTDVVRRYSLTPAGPDAWEIAVLREDGGRGGSAALHRSFAVGTRLRCEPPRNDFVLHGDARPAVLVAGGIGITAIRPMALALAARGASYQLHYASRSPDEMAYRDRLPAHARLYFSQGGTRLDLERVFDDAAEQSVFYACGPARLIDAMRALASQRGIDEERMRFERFSAPVYDGDRTVELVLRRSGKALSVPPGRTLLDAILDAGVDVPSECRVGNCGTCAVRVIDGIPEHRDHALTAREHAGGTRICTCVSRARSDRLVLDL